MALQSWSDDFFVKTSRGLWYLGCLLLPALVLRVGAIALSDIAFAASAGVLLLAVLGTSASSAALSPPPINIPAKPWVVASFLVVIAAFMTNDVSVSPRDNLLVAARMVLIWVVWRWQASRLLSRAVHFRRSIVALLVGGGLSAGVAAAQVLLHATVFGQGVDDVFSSRASGLTGHVNDQGGVLAVTVVLGTGLWFHRSSKVVLALTLCCTAGLVLSGSVTGMLSCAVGVVLLAVRSGTRQLAKRAFQAAILVVGALLTSSKLQAGLSAGDPLTRFRIATGTGDTGLYTGNASTLELRIETWKFAWARIQLNPFHGVGLDPQSGPTIDKETQTHNVLLLFWYQGGAIALVAVTLALLAGLVVAYRRDALVTPLQLTFAGAFTAACVFAMTAPITYQRYVWLPAVLAVAAACRRPEDDVSDPVTDPTSEPVPQRTDAVSA